MADSNQNNDSDMLGGYSGDGPEVIGCGCIPSLIPKAFRDFFLRALGRDPEHKPTREPKEEKPTDPRSYELTILFPQPLTPIQIADETILTEKVEMVLKAADKLRFFVGILYPPTPYEPREIEIQPEERTKLDENAERKCVKPSAILYKKLLLLADENPEEATHSFLTTVESPEQNGIETSQMPIIEELLFTITKRVEIALTLGIMDKGMIGSILRRLDLIAENLDTPLVYSTDEINETIPIYLRLAYAMHGIILDNLRTVDDLINLGISFNGLSQKYISPANRNGQSQKIEALGNLRSKATSAIIQFRKAFEDGGELPKDWNDEIRKQYATDRYISSHADDKKMINLLSLASLLPQRRFKRTMIYGGLLALYSGIEKNCLFDEKKRVALNRPDNNPLKRTIERALFEGIYSENTFQGRHSIRQKAYRIAIAIGIKVDSPLSDTVFWHIDPKNILDWGTNEINHLGNANNALSLARDIYALLPLCTEQETIELINLLNYIAKELLSQGAFSWREENFLQMVEFVHKSIFILTRNKTSSSLEKPSEKEETKAQAGTEIQAPLQQDFTQNIISIISHAHQILYGYASQDVFGDTEIAYRIASKMSKEDITLWDSMQLKKLQKTVSTKIGPDFLPTLARAIGIDQTKFEECLGAIDSLEKVAGFLKVLNPQDSEEVNQTENPQNVLESYFQAILGKAPLPPRLTDRLIKALDISQRWHPEVLEDLQEGKKPQKINTQYSIAIASLGMTIEAIYGSVESAITMTLLNRLDIPPFTDETEVKRRQSEIYGKVKVFLTQHETAIRRAICHALLQNAAALKENQRQNRTTLTQLMAQANEQIEDMMEAMNVFTGMLKSLFPTKK